MSILISNARAAVATATSNGSTTNLLAASDAVNITSGALQIIGSTTGYFTTFYIVAGGTGDTILNSYPFKVDIEAAMDGADAKAAAAARRARERAIAKDALKLYGLNTKNLPGTSNGSEACAKTVQMVLKAATGALRPMNFLSRGAEYRRSTSTMHADFGVYDAGKKIIRRVCILYWS